MRLARAGLWVAVLASCGLPPPPANPSQEGAEGEEAESSAPKSSDVPKPSAGGTPDASTTKKPAAVAKTGDAGAGKSAESPSTEAAQSTATIAMRGNSAVETACNGVDDDADGVTDLLLPIAANACTTGRPGPCGTGFAGCERGQRVCYTPGPSPEVADGIDNDCNGAVDDVAVTSVRPRAILLVPRYAWIDAAPDIATVTATLAQAGIPFDSQRSGTDWESWLEGLDQYSLVIVPGYLLGASVGSVVREKLESFAKRGGVVVVFKPVGTPDHHASLELCGLTKGTRRRDANEIRFDGAAVPLTTSLDSPEERTLPVNAKASKVGVEVWTFEADSSEGTQVVANAYVAGKSIGPVLTRRPVGRGAVYAIGHDLMTVAGTRCYVNCFEPFGDVLRLVLEGALREGSSGHTVVKHTSPSLAPSTLLVTHDVYQHDAQNSGAWGPPGAIQVADVERARGVRATFNVATNYTSPEFNAKLVEALCNYGMCPVGLNSVTRPEGFARLPEGTCAETRATYGKPATLCGEVRVASQVIKEMTGQTPRTWRSPFMALNPHLFDVLAKNGIVYDSSFGIGDLPYNLPVEAARLGTHQEHFHHKALLEFPVACEDAIGIAEGKGYRRVELEHQNRDMFGTQWEYVLLQNARNRSVTTLLLHPSRGSDVTSDNLRTKVEALDRILVRASEASVSTAPLEEFGDFWRARLAMTLDARYEAGIGYRGTLVFGPVTSPGLSLEFGDRIAEFTCDGCGEVKTMGKRVVLLGTPAPKTKAEFTAKVK